MYEFFKLLQILPTMLDFLLRFGPAFLPGDEATVTKSVDAAWRLLLAKYVQISATFKVLSFILCQLQESASRA